MCYLPQDCPDRGISFVGIQPVELPISENRDTLSWREEVSESTWCGISDTAAWMKHIDLAGYPSNDAAVSCFLGQFGCRCRTAGPLMCLIRMRHSSSVGLCFHLLRSDEMKSQWKAVPVIRWTLTIGSGLTYVRGTRRFGSLLEIVFSFSFDWLPLRERNVLSQP